MTVLERAARALEAEAETFRSPVHFYVQHEWIQRWEEANPDKEPCTDPATEGKDWTLESWKILARAVLQALREPSEGMKDRGGFICSPCSDNPVRWKALNRVERDFSEDYATEVWQAMIDAALAE